MQSMQRPSWRGWLAIGLPVLEGLLLPAALPAMEGGIRTPAPASAWLTALIATAVCLAASAFAAFGRRTVDVLFAVLASFGAGLVFGMFLDAA